MICSSCYLGFTHHCIAHAVLGTNEGIVIMIVVTGATGTVGRHLVDLLPHNVVRAITRTPQNAGLPAQVEVVEGDMRAIPLEDASFDAAVAGFAISHVDAPERALAEMGRVVRPGCRVIAAVNLRTSASRSPLGWKPSSSIEIR